jgi:hypothetical protein
MGIGECGGGGGEKNEKAVTKKKDKDETDNKQRIQGGNEGRGMVVLPSVFGEYKACFINMLFSMIPCICKPFLLKFNFCCARQ